MNLHLYDASAYIHRFFHACPDMRRQSDNEPVGALAGFCSMMMDEIERAPARGVTHMAMVYDTGKATFRNKMYPAYKANRKPKPEALQSQIRLMRDAVDAFGIASTDCDGYEADDVIATWTRIAVEAGGTVTIHSSDKDLMQLVSRSVTQRCPVKGREYCGIDVLEKFGVHPHQLGDVLALMGDTADNIPGIAGIGPKTAASLIAAHGNLDLLFAGWSRASVNYAVRRAISDPINQKRVQLSRELIELFDEAGVNGDLGQFEVRPIDVNRADAFMGKMEFVALRKRLKKAMNRGTQFIGGGR